MLKQAQQTEVIIFNKSEKGIRVMITPLVDWLPVPSCAHNNLKGYFIASPEPAPVTVIMIYLK